MSLVNPSLQTLTGRCLTVPNDRVVEVSAEDAGPVMGTPGWIEVKGWAEAVT